MKLTISNHYSPFALAALLIFFGFQASSAVSGPLGAVADKIAPHRAAYELKLEEVVSGSQIVHAEGFMSFDWLRRCDGWTSDQRLFLVITYPENRTIKFKAVSVTWESDDGLRFRFNISRDGVGDEEERIVGEATLKRIGGPGEVKYESPKGKKEKLPAGTVFPTRHTLLLLQKALSGERFDKQKVFDGGELKGVSPVTAIFFPKQAKIDLPKPVKGYSPKPVFPMKLAFFAPSGGDAAQDSLPESEYKIFYQANGVAPRLHLNFGDFKFRGDMIGFERLPKLEC